MYVWLQVWSHTCYLTCVRHIIYFGPQEAKSSSPTRDSTYMDATVFIVLVSWLMGNCLNKEEPSSRLTLEIQQSRLYFFSERMVAEELQNFLDDTFSLDPFQNWGSVAGWEDSGLGHQLPSLDSESLILAEIVKMGVLLDTFLPMGTRSQMLPRWHPSSCAKQLDPVPCNGHPDLTTVTCCMLAYPWDWSGSSNCSKM